MISIDDKWYYSGKYFGCRAFLIKGNLDLKVKPKLMTLFKPDEIDNRCERAIKWLSDGAMYVMGNQDDLKNINPDILKLVKKIMGDDFKILIDCRRKNNAIKLINSKVAYIMPIIK